MSFSGEHAIAQDEVLTALRELPDNSFDGALLDPPYGLGTHQPTAAELVAYLTGSAAELNTGGDFMGKDWHVPSLFVWREILRVLKPGAALLSYGGSRTAWLISLGLCAAGFEIRDTLMWQYAKGFPKSFNVSKALDERSGPEFLDPYYLASKAWAGTGTALKPGYEPIILARKPLEGTIVENVLKWGTGALDIDACRLERDPDDVSGYSKHQAHGPNVAMSGANYPREPKPDAEARWPANVVLTHDEDCIETPNGGGCVEDCPIYLLNKQSGIRPSRKSVTRNGGGNQGGAVYDWRVPMARPDSGYTDSGGASRFFFSAKVSRKEREFGCEHLPLKTAGEATGGRKEGSAGLDNPRAGAGRTSGAHNHHPTLKPLALNKWLASLIRPRSEAPTLLVPYSGAGSEVIGALQAGWPFVFGIEREAEYVAIAEARIAAWAGVEDLKQKRAA